jgi:hypothetical protein
LKVSISASISALFSGGAESDAHNAPNAPQTPQDPDLALVVERWPNLPEHIKQTIKTLLIAGK